MRKTIHCSRAHSLSIHISMNLSLYIVYSLNEIKQNLLISFKFELSLNIFLVCFFISFLFYNLLETSWTCIFTLWTSILFNRVKFTGHQVGLWWLGYQPCSLGSQPPRPSESINLACLRQPMSADQFIYWLASSKTNFGDDRDNTFWSYLTKAESSFT